MQTFTINGVELYADLSPECILDTDIKDVFCTLSNAFAQIKIRFQCEDNDPTWYVLAPERDRKHEYAVLSALLKAEKTEHEIEEEVEVSNYELITRADGWNGLVAAVEEFAAD